MSMGVAVIVIVMVIMVVVEKERRYHHLLTTEVTQIVLTLIEVLVLVQLLVQLVAEFVVGRVLAVLVVLGLLLVLLAHLDRHRMQLKPDLHRLLMYEHQPHLPLVIERVANLTHLSLYPKFHQAGTVVPPGCLLLLGRYLHLHLHLHQCLLHLNLNLNHLLVYQRHPLPVKHLRHLPLLYILLHLTIVVLWSLTVDRKEVKEFQILCLFLLQM